MGDMMKIIIAVLAFVLCAPVHAQDIKTLADELAGEIGRVDLNAGITQKQAETMAQYYCQRFIGGCGSAYPAIDQNLDWVMTPKTGVAGVADQDAILIGKHTGTISWKTGPDLRLADLIGSRETAPKPLNMGGAEPRRLPDDALVPTAKLQFVVSPSGAVTHTSFRRSSGNMKCDLAAMRIVESWRFPPRKQPIALVANVKNCAH